MEQWPAPGEETPVFTTILVPLDGSRIAEAALGYAALLPSERVRLLRVEPEYVAGGAGEAPDRLAGAEAEAHAYLDRQADEPRRQGREVELVVVRGDPAEQIIAHAGDADLIVMTTNGLGAGGRALFGSVADRVVRHAVAPTLVVRTEGKSSGPPLVARIVVPLDGSDLASKALPVAAETAELLGVPIHLVRVVDGDPVRAAVQAGSRAAAAYSRSLEDARQHAVADLETEERKLRARNIKTSTDVRVGYPAAELLSLIAPSDLVVMTTHGRGGIRRWLLGSVADKLVHQASAPVLLVRPGTLSDS